MNTESATIFTKLDKLTEDNSNINFILPEIGIDMINSTSDYEVEEFKE